MITKKSQFETGPTKPMGNSSNSDPSRLRSDYLAVRHMSPDAILHLRACLDFGVSPETLRRLIKTRGKKSVATPQNVEIALGALEYMILNPRAGIARFAEGSYTWETE